MGRQVREARKRQEKEMARQRRRTPPELPNGRSIGIVKLKSDMTTTDRGNYYVVKRNPRGDGTETVTIYNPLADFDDGLVRLGKRQDWEWVDHEVRNHDADDQTDSASAGSSEMEERPRKRRRKESDYSPALRL